MRIVEKNYTRKSDGHTTTTLHVSTEFSDFYKKESEGRYCEGQAVETIYAGSYDCSKITIGSEIQIAYGKAIPMKSGGIYQPIQEIKILK